MELCTVAVAADGSRAHASVVVVSTAPLPPRWRFVVIPTGGAGERGFPSCGLQSVVRWKPLLTSTLVTAVTREFLCSVGNSNVRQMFGGYPSEGSDRRLNTSPAGPFAMAIAKMFLKKPVRARFPLMPNPGRPMITSRHQSLSRTSLNMTPGGLSLPWTVVAPKE